MANGEQVNGRALNALPEAQALDARPSVIEPLLPPPVRPVPAVTPVIVPAPGKVCPVAKVIFPLLAMFNPVSLGEPEPLPYKRFRVPAGVDVLFPLGSVCH